VCGQVADNPAGNSQPAATGCGDVTHGGCDKVGGLSDDSDCAGDVTVDRFGGPYDAVDGDSGWAGTAGDRVGRLSDEADCDSDLRGDGTGSVTGDRVDGSHDVIGSRDIA